jgi:hypothetical protein
MHDGASALRVCAAVAAALSLVGCSVANLSYAEVVGELDSVVRFEGTGNARRLVYQDEPLVSPWYLRFTLFYPLRPVLRGILGGRPSPSKVVNPSGHARELVAVLGDKAGSDLQACAHALQRLVPIAELDASPLNRVTALDAMSCVAGSLRLPLLGEMVAPEAWPAVPTQEAEWIAALRDSRPAVRPPELPLLEAPARRRYADAIAGLSRRPLAAPGQRLALVQELGDALAGERDPELVEPTAAALRAALGHCLRWTVIDALQGQEPALADVRLQAAAILHRDGGPDAVPTILALMAASPEQVREGVPRFDPHPLVLLRLVHMCGQLDAERAARSVRLPGRAAWEPVAPLDFLADLVLRGTARWSGLRTVAHEALCRCLGRPVDYELEWVERWYRARQGSS